MSLNAGQRDILGRIEQLLESGVSLVVTTLDAPETEDARAFASTVSLKGHGRRCIQRVIMPDGTIICVKYEGD